jgi:capsular exopolysaccharide synthesis family protein
MLSRQRWVILGWTLAFGMLALLWAYAQTPVYEGTASVVIQREGPNHLQKQGNYYVEAGPEYYQTHFELLKSRGVLIDAARVLHLADRAEYRPRKTWKDRALAMAPMFVLEAMGRRGRPEAVDPERLLIEAFERNVTVIPLRGTWIARISVRSQDPAFAAEAANAIASAYVKRTQEAKAKREGKSLDWFAGRLDGLRKKVLDSEQSLYAYRAKYGLLETSERPAVLVQKLAQLNAEWVKAEVKLSTTKARYEQVAAALKSAGPDEKLDWSRLDAASEVLGSSLIQMLKTQEVKLAGHVAELEDKYGPQHPKMAYAKSELTDLRERIVQEVKKIYDSVGQEYRLAVAQERATRDAIRRQQQEKGVLEQNEIEYRVLEREAESNRQLYDAFLKEMKETGLFSEFAASNVYVADAADIPDSAVKPKKKLTLLLGLMAGLMTGLGLAYYREGKDHSLKAPSDVQRYLPRMPVLGVLPQIRYVNGVEASRTIVVESDPLSGAAECYRAIRTSLLFSMHGKTAFSLLITSAGPGEGKTTLAVNLSTAIAQLHNAKVLLINADLRSPVAHALFRDSNGHPPAGLADVLVGRIAPEDGVYPTEISNLSMMPSGERPPNPAELIHTDRMIYLLEWAREHGYITLIDAPPVLPVTDPVILARHVDGVLFVTSIGETTREACKMALQRLVTAGGNMVGIVVQKAHVDTLGYYQHPEHHLTTV